MTSSESHELTAHRSIGLDVSPNDPSQLTHTTVEEVQGRLPEFHELLTAAAAGAHIGQDPAAQTPKANSKIVWSPVKAALATRRFVVAST